MTRVEKYKDYRNSLIKEGSTDISVKKGTNNNRPSTTTLPINQVIERLNDSDEIIFYKKKIKKKFVLILSLSIFFVIAIALIVTVGILLWRK